MRKVVAFHSGSIRNAYNDHELKDSQPEDNSLTPGDSCFLVKHVF